MILCTHAEGILLIISGLYYFKESLIFGCVNLIFTIPMVLMVLNSEATHCILQVLFCTVYNLIDQKNHSVCELENFRNLTKIERRSLHLTQFVNRLLPKHVKLNIFYRNLFIFCIKLTIIDTRTYY